MLQKILIIIPCYNEENSLPRVLNELKDLKLPTQYNLSILVVNDCSKDKTAELANFHGAKILDLACNLGIGGAVQAGFKFAQINNFDLAIQLDGDGQHPPSEIVKLLDAYTTYNADVVIGSRFLIKEGYQSSFTRRLGIKYFYKLNRILRGKPIYDCTSGFRLLNRKALLVASKNYPDDYPEPESLVIFAKKGLSIKEVPVVMRARTGGTSSIQRSASLYYCIKVTIAMFFSYIRNTSNYG